MTVTEADRAAEVRRAARAAITAPRPVASTAILPAPVIADRGRSIHQQRKMTMSSDALRKVAVKLSRPVLAFNYSMDEVFVREPTAADFFKIGEPVVFVGTRDSGSFADVPTAINEYLNACVVSAQGDFVGPVIMKELGMSDARAIKKALLGFFQDAPETTSG